MKTIFVIAAKLIINGAERRGRHIAFQESYM